MLKFLGVIRPAALPFPPTAHTSGASSWTSHPCHWPGPGGRGRGSESWLHNTITVIAPLFSCLTPCYLPYQTVAASSGDFEV